MYLDYSMYPQSFNENKRRKETCLPSVDNTRIPELSTVLRQAQHNIA